MGNRRFYGKAGKAVGLFRFRETGQLHAQLVFGEPLDLDRFARVVVTLGQSHLIWLNSDGDGDELDEGLVGFAVAGFAGDLEADAVAVASDHAVAGRVRGDEHGEIGFDVASVGGLARSAVEGVVVAGIVHDRSRQDAAAGGGVTRDGARGIDPHYLRGPEKFSPER